MGGRIRGKGDNTELMMTVSERPPVHKGLFDFDKVHGEHQGSCWVGSTLITAQQVKYWGGLPCGDGRREGEGPVAIN